MGKVKGFFGKKESERESEREPEETKEVDPKDRYKELVDQIMKKFDEPKAIDYYMKELEKIKKLKDFLSSEEGKTFKEMVRASRR
jgi:hypothetical protein